jgi:hypothetical protein
VELDTGNCPSRIETIAPSPQILHGSYTTTDGANAGGIVVPLLSRRQEHHPSLNSNCCTASQLVEFNSPLNPTSATSTHVTLPFASGILSLIDIVPVIQTLQMAYGVGAEVLLDGATERVGNAVMVGG